MDEVLGLIFGISALCVGFIILFSLGIIAVIKFEKFFEIFFDLIDRKIEESFLFKCFIKFMSWITDKTDKRQIRK